MVRRFRSCLLVLAFVASSATLTAREAGLPVTVAWDANSEPTVIGYRVYVGTTPSVYAETFDAGNATSFTYRNGIAGQRYYFAVAAYSAGSLEGPRSSEVSTVIGSTDSTPPPSGGTVEPPPPVTSPAPGGDPAPGSDPPPATDLPPVDSPPPPDSGDPPGDEVPPGIVLEPASVTGGTVRLAWRAEGSLTLIEYLVEVGSTPGASDIYNAPAGTQTSFSASVRNGTYFARVRARTPGDSSVLSNEVGFAIGKGGCSAMPNTPGEPTGSIRGGVATIRWKQAVGATSFVVQVGAAPGRSDLFNGNVGSTKTVRANVPPGMPVYARVIAVNACGQSAASAEVQIQ